MQVSDFLEKLSKQTGTPSSRVFNRQTRKLEKLSLNNPNLLGRYQVIPFCSVVTDFPYISGLVKQINVPRRTTDQSGQESRYNAWIHIPSSNFYQMKDDTGRAVSSLTAEDENILNNASMLWEELYNELDARTNWSETKDIIRKRNYTLFTGYCLNFWKYGSVDSRVPDRQNFSALFMVTTKSFTNSVETNINDKSIMEGGDQSWVDRIYNNQLKNRDGFILFSIARDKDRAGFQASIQHEYGRANALSQVEISQEDFDAGMGDPVYLFLGWQASNQDADKPFGSRRLFNARLMKETSEYMAKLLAAIRAAKAAGTDINEAIDKVNQSVYSEGTTPENITPVVQPTAPASAAPSYGNPGAPQIDPLSGASVQSQAQGNPFASSGGFSTPDFSKAAPGFEPSGMPF